eukprot:gene15676-4719_t
MRHRVCLRRKYAEQLEIRSRQEHAENAEKLGYGMNPQKKGADTLVYSWMEKENVPYQVAVKDEFEYKETDGRAELQ